MDEGYTNTYLIPIRNYSELAPKCIAPIENNRAVIDSIASDGELSEHQAEGLQDMDELSAAGKIEPSGKI